MVELQPLKWDWGTSATANELGVEDEEHKSARGQV
jgi:hypothetical protein